MSFTGMTQVSADNKLKSKRDSTVQHAVLNFMKDSSRVGLSVGILDNGNEYIYNYGEVVKGSKKKPTKNTIYEIGSITKTFTALLIAHAINDHKLDINEDIRKYLPGKYPNIQYPGPHGGPLKLGYLISHTSQLPFSVPKEDVTVFTREDFLNELHKIKLDTLRPFTYRYSNFGYEILGYILETIYHKPYEELVKQLITDPLKMTMTKVTYSASEKINLCKGYDIHKTEMPRIQNSFPAEKIFPSAGSISSTITDMLKYIKYQMAEKDIIVKMTHRITYFGEDAIGFQWDIGKTWDWNYYIRGNGGTKGYSSFCVMYPDYNIGIILLSNQAGGDALRKLYETANEIFDVLKSSR